MAHARDRTGSLGVGTMLQPTELTRHTHIYKHFEVYLQKLRASFFFLLTIIPLSRLSQVKTLWQDYFLVEGAYFLPQRIRSQIMLGDPAF